MKRREVKVKVNKSRRRTIIIIIMTATMMIVLMKRRLLWEEQNGQERSMIPWHPADYKFIKGQIKSWSVHGSS
jgi:hypothetical protein